MKPACSVFWFKRDLRLEDNVPLDAANRSGAPVLLVYLLEPSLETDPHHSPRHWNFVRESLLDLQCSLERDHTKILCVRQEALPFFRKLNRLYRIEGVFSHMETGIGRTYQRDLALGNWFRLKGIPWRESQQNGVVRGRRDRKGWKEAWHAFMNEPCLQKSKPLAGYLPLQEIRELEANHTLVDLHTEPHVFQPGGRGAALATLDDFFSERLQHYNEWISKPELSRVGCSRLSPYLAWGNLSIREIYQRLRDFKKEGRWGRQASAFGSRLRWHCHFIQKFEMEPRMEFEPVNRAFLSLEQTREEDWIDAWKSGRTGYPLVDAAMRCVQQTGYLNFRLRALVVSFLTHHLFQDFRSGSHWLAQQFLDFEPGIHYGQFQMQAGLTGTNTIRVYNPTKNAQEHDPEAVFIKTYLPELSSLPAALAIEPWQVQPMEEQLYQFAYGKDYPKRIVDITLTRKRALDQLYAIRRSPYGYCEKERILKRHTLADRKSV